MDTTVETTIPKVVKKRVGPACSDCKSRKKRCTYRGAEAEIEVSPQVMPTPAPAFAMKTRKRQKKGTLKLFSNFSNLATNAMNQTPVSEVDSASPKEGKIEKETIKKAINSKTTATKAKVGEKAKAKGAVVEADPAVDELIEGEKHPRPMKRVKRKQAAKVSPADHPAPTHSPAADDADADAASTPSASPLAASGPMPDHPDDTLKGAIRMSVHQVFSRSLETRLAELKANFLTAQEAMEVVINSAAAVTETVDMWKEVWLKDQ
ncbi:hypothetical protein N7507_008471 [Penicillium longicatenatum]|nr:hypothetical protein N7507_008471 [Penicillium longicatenatum]